MNKTLKTIAWICLALGLLGTAVDAGMLVAGRKMAAVRQVAIEDIKGQIQTSKMPYAKNICIAKDADQDGKPDGDCLKLQAPGQPGQPGFGGRLQQRNTWISVRSVVAGRRMAGRWILPLFFLVLGPILLVVGAVILLVNREHKKVDSKEEKADLVKSEKSSANKKKG